MRRDDLKPCPFCGSGRVTVWNIRDGQQAVCKECKSTGAPTFHGLDGPKATWGHAVEAWNRREPETDEERCCRVLETIAPPDNGSVQEVLSAALQCANAWVPEARILGNVRAGDLSRALSAALSIEQTQPVAWMYQFKTNAPVLMVEKRNWAETHFEWTETPLYAHRPVSALVNAEADADVVERWQPIETAPKDGTKIIATGQYGVRVVWWGAGAFNRKINAYDRDWTDCVTYGFKLTHWRPLPAPPTATRIADSAEAGGSATLSTGGDHG